MDELANISDIVEQEKNSYSSDDNDANKNSDTNYTVCEDVPSGDRNQPPDAPQKPAVDMSQQMIIETLKGLQKTVGRLMKKRGKKKHRVTQETSSASETDCSQEETSSSWHDNSSGETPHKKQKLRGKKVTSKKIKIKVSPSPHKKEKAYNKSALKLTLKKQPSSASNTGQLSTANNNGKRLRTANNNQQLSSVTNNIPPTTTNTNNNKQLSSASRGNKKQLSSANQMQLSSAGKKKQLRSAPVKQLSSATIVNTIHTDNDNVINSVNGSDVDDAISLQHIYNSVTLHPSDDDLLHTAVHTRNSGDNDSSCSLAPVPLVVPNNMYEGIDLPFPVEVPGQPLEENMAELINDMWGKNYTHKQLLQVYKKYPTPQNISDKVLAPEMNPEIFSLYERWQCKADLKEMGTQRTLVRVMSAMARQNQIIAESCCEDALKTESRQMVVDSAAMLSKVTKDTSLKRRSFARSVLRPEYKKLCQPSRPIAKMLFGDNLSEDIKELNVTNRLSQKATFRPTQQPHINRGRGYPPSNQNYRFQRNQPFLGRGRGQNHRPRGNYSQKQSSNNRGAPNFAWNPHWNPNSKY